MQPDERTLESHKALVKHKIRQLGVSIKGLERTIEEQGFAEDPRIGATTHRLNFRVSELKDYEKLSNELKSCGPALSQIIGHVWFAPSYEPRQLGYPVHPNQPRHNQHASDWALFEIDPRKHERPLGEITNCVFVGHEWTRKVTSALREAREFRSLVTDVETTLALQGTIPSEELLNPPLKNNANDPTIAVAKVGRSSGLTVGFGSMCKSVKREIFDKKFYYTEQWCIIEDRRSKDQLDKTPFSASGDSGACVFDLQGRIGGLLTGGISGDEGAQDTTYVTPIDWILKGMEEDGLDISII